MKYFEEFPLPERPSIPGATVAITGFGASRDNILPAIKKAIEYLVEKGGGKLVVPWGEWKCEGPIHLKSNMELHLEEGSRIVFSKEHSNYLLPVFTQLAGIRCFAYSPMIYGDNLTNVIVSGQGELDAQGEAWWPWKYRQPGMENLIVCGENSVPLEERVYDRPEYGVRPRMLQILRSKNVCIEGVTLRNSPSWTVHPVWCENVLIRNVTVINPHKNAPNTDGINIESCKNILVENCFIDTGDDAFCLKAGRGRDAREVGIPLQNMVIRNCRVVHCHGAVTIGSETSAGIKNAYIHDCNFGNPWVAIRIKTQQGRGGIVENIDFTDIVLDTATKSAVNITARYNGEPLDRVLRPTADIPVVKNIHIENFKCDSAPIGIKVEGLQGHNLENISFRNISITSEKGICADCVSNLNFENVNFY